MRTDEQLDAELDVRVEAAIEPDKHIEPKESADSEPAKVRFDRPGETELQRARSERYVSSKLNLKVIRLTQNQAQSRRDKDFRAGRHVVRVKATDTDVGTP